MGRLQSSQEIYNRIRWEPGLEESWFIIGYEDRDLGMQEVPFSTYVEGGDIPWHRIQYFRCGDTVVWDRRARIDKLASIERIPSDPRADRKPAPRPFASRDALLAHLQKKELAWVLVRPVPAYRSFVQEVCLHAPPGTGKARISVEWQSYVMDWMGDATHVRIVYELDSIEEALDCVRWRYGREATELTAALPPLPRGALHVPRQLIAEAQDAWRRLKSDFEAGRLTDSDLRVVQRSSGS